MDTVVSTPSMATFTSDRLLPSASLTSKTIVGIDDDSRSARSLHTSRICAGQATAAHLRTAARASTSLPCFWSSDDCELAAMQSSSMAARETPARSIAARHEAPSSRGASSYLQTFLIWGRPLSSVYLTYSQLGVAAGAAVAGGGLVLASCAEGEACGFAGGKCGVAVDMATAVTVLTAVVSATAVVTTGVTTVALCCGAGCCCVMGESLARGVATPLSFG